MLVSGTIAKLRSVYVMMFPRVWWLTSIFEVLAIFRLAMISVELGVVRDKGTSGLPSVRVVEPVAGFFLLGMMLFLLFLKDVYVLTNMMNNNRAAPPGTGFLPSQWGFPLLKSAS